MMMTMKNRNDLYLPSIGACVCLSNAKQTGRPTYKNVRIARSGTHTKSINEIAGKKLIQNEFQNHPSKNLLFLWQVKWASFSGKNSKWFFSIKKNVWRRSHEYFSFALLFFTFFPHSLSCTARVLSQQNQLGQVNLCRLYKNGQNSISTEWNSSDNKTMFVMLFPNNEKKEYYSFFIKFPHPCSE